MRLVVKKPYQSEIIIELVPGTIIEVDEDNEVVPVNSNIIHLGPGFDRAKANATITLGSILYQVNKFYGFDIKGSSRATRHVAARRVFFQLARRLTGYSLTEIGKACGHRDHTTVMYNLDEWESTVLNFPAFKRDLETLTDILTEKYELGGLIEKVAY